MPGCRQGVAPSRHRSTSIGFPAYGAWSAPMGPAPARLRKQISRVRRSLIRGMRCAPNPGSPVETPRLSGRCAVRLHRSAFREEPRFDTAPPQWQTPSGCYDSFRLVNSRWVSSEFDRAPCHFTAGLTGTPCSFTGFDQARSIHRSPDARAAVFRDGITLARASGFAGSRTARSMRPSPFEPGDDRRQRVPRGLRQPVRCEWCAAVFGWTECRIH